MIETEQATAKEATKRLNTLIPLSLHQNLKAHAQKKGRCHTLTSVITEVLTTYLKQPFERELWIRNHSSIPFISCLKVGFTGLS